MQKLKTFFNSLFNSLTNPSYYQDIIKAPASFSWKYFLFLNFLMSFLIIGMVLIPASLFNLTEAIDRGFDLYPEELVITADETGLSVNQELPYSIPFPAELFDDVPEHARDNMEVNDLPLEEIEDLSLITFDSDEYVTDIQDFYASESFMVVTESTIYFLKDVDTGEVHLYPMPEFEEPFEVSSLKVQELRDKIVSHPFVSKKMYLLVIAVVVIILFFPIMTLARVLTAAFYSVAAWLVAKFVFKKLKLSYSKVVQVSFHSLTLVILAATVGEATELFSLAGWNYFWVYLLWTGFIFFTINKPANTLSQSTSVKAKSTKKSASNKSASKAKKKTSSKRK
jgi:hypothetical protein